MEKQVASILKRLKNERNLDCDASKACGLSYYVGGFYCLDLIAWAMVTKRAVCMIRMDCYVDVFEPFKPPYTTALKDASPRKRLL